MSPTRRTRAATAALVEQWSDEWSSALALWSRFTRLRQPILCTTGAQAKKEGLRGSFAMIRLADQSVVVNLQEVVRLGLADRPREVLGHEIGHHILAPATLLESGRVIARMRVALPGEETHAPLLANMYADLLINDRLQRDEGLAMDGLYASILAANPPSTSLLWAMYLRIYEILWGLPTGRLRPPVQPGASRSANSVEGDAQLGARLLRSYASQWADGAGRFAALCFPYLNTKDQALAPAAAWADTVAGGAGADIPLGLADDDASAQAGAIHPANDPALNGLGQDDDRPAGPGEVDGPPLDPGPRSGGGQRREPFEYGQILKALGMDLSDHDVAVRYYRERATPHLIPFPTVAQPVPGETLPEGYQPWSPGEPLADVDWLQTVLGGPVVIPGVTTVQRVHGIDDATPPRGVPLDLDLYIDSSGSMPNPQRRLSYPALAGTVLAMSALRAGARVQATLWSGATQFLSTDGFVDDREEILRVILGHLGGLTAFPLHKLRDTYDSRTAQDPPAHVLVISDSGISTIFKKDERGTSGEVIQRAALSAARGGGTWVLEISPQAALIPQGEALGWTVEPVRSLADLVGFARRFARATYATESAGTTTNAVSHGR